MTEQLPAGEERSPLETLLEQVQQELAQARDELRENELMLEQSRGEVERLTQRNASLGMHLQQIQSQGSKASMEELRSAYDAALEARQRLLVMRAQVEKLQAEQQGLQRLVSVLEQVLALLEAGAGEEVSGDRGLKSVEIMINAQESERRRLSRQMHDGPAQSLSNFILQTEIATRLFDVNPDQARQELMSLKSAATATFQQVRSFIFDLRPMMLDDLGLVPTIKRYVESYREQHQVDLQVQITGEERRLENVIEVMIFRAVQELLTNALQHGEATRIRLYLDMGAEQVKVRVEDDGKGFDTSTLDAVPGLGLRLLRERVYLLGGTLDIHSELGQGTDITFTVPAKSAPVFA